MRIPFYLSGLFGMLTLALPAAALAQTTVIYNSNGFESPMTTGRLAGYFTGGGLPNPPGPGAQQGWYTTDPREDPVFGFLFGGGQSGFIQNAVVQSGTQAFRVDGTKLVNDSSFSGGTFWWKYPDNPPFAGNVFNPVANGTPIVVAQTGFRRDDAGFTTDIPLKGFYFEGLRATTGIQRQITQVSVDLNGVIQAFTIGGFNVSSDQTVPNGTWVDLRVEMDFSSQTFQVFLNNSLVTFNGGAISTVPFRDTDAGTGGPFDRLREAGFNAFFNSAAGVTTGDAYFDNYQIFARAAIPEPTTIAFVGIAVGAAGMYVARRRRTEALNAPEATEE